MPPRGSNSPEEQDRIMSREIAPGQRNKGGTGVDDFEKNGYGNDSMQKNPKGMPADKNGI